MWELLNMDLMDVWSELGNGSEKESHPMTTSWSAVNSKSVLSHAR